MHMSAQGVEIDVAHPEIGAASIAMSFQGGRPKFLLLFQWCAVLMAFASVVAALPVAALSFGSYGTAKLLGKVSPLRATYEFLSKAYDRFIDRLGRKLLRDSRDTPALRLIVSLTVTVVPIFRSNWL